MQLSKGAQFNKLLIRVGCPEDGARAGVLKVSRTLCNMPRRCEHRAAFPWWPMAKHNPAQQHVQLAHHNFPCLLRFLKLITRPGYVPNDKHKNVHQLL